jgi:HK97 family phage portal protein
VLAFSGVFSPLTLIAADISKLRARLVEEDADGICTEIKSPLGAVLRRPNRHQNRIQFWAQWILCKLLHGNTYALKVRDQRGVVVRLYILDPQRVTPLVTDAGDVYYQCAAEQAGCGHRPRRKSCTIAGTACSIRWSAFHRCTRARCPRRWAARFRPTAGRFFRT